MGYYDAPSAKKKKSIDAKLGRELTFFHAVGSESPQHPAGPRCGSQRPGRHLGEGDPSLVSSDKARFAFSACREKLKGGGTLQ